MSASMEARVRNAARRYGSLSALRHVGTPFASEPAGWGPACAAWLAAYDGEDSHSLTLWGQVSGIGLRPKWLFESDVSSFGAAQLIAPLIAPERCPSGRLYAVLSTSQPGRPVVIYFDGLAYYCQTGLAKGAQP